MAERQLDVVIVGSGAGGGAVARSLAPLVARGVSVAVLEWGDRVEPEDCDGHELEMAERLFVDSGGVLTRDRTLTLATGRAFGGSTVVYTGTSLRMPREVLDSWAVPGLEFDDLDRRARAACDQNNVHLLPAGEVNENNRLFRTGCEALGYRVRQFPLNVKGCRGSGLCNLGCPNGAKQGTHVVQLPAAEAAGVEMVTRCRVLRVADDGCEVVALPGSTWPEGEHRIRARVVVLAGGTYGTPPLLLASGLGAELWSLGRFITLHPALILVGEHAHRVDGFLGHPKSYYCDHFAASDRFLLETCMYFPFVTAKNVIGFGPEHAELMRAFPRLQMILVLAFDPARATNRITVAADGVPVVDYRLEDRVLDSLHRAMIASARVFFAAGARRVHVPAARRFLVDAVDADRLEELVPRSGVRPGRLSITSAHLMGGCRMGAGPSDSVTDSWGRVHGHPRLRVADSSLFPRCSEVNPYVTVMALADRVAEGILKDAGELLA